MKIKDISEVKMEGTTEQQILTFGVFMLPMHSDEKIPAKLMVDYEKGNLTIKFKEIKKSTKNDRYWFGQLRKLDEELNKIGYRLLCNGTSIGVNCYGFCSNMGDGSKAYLYDARTVVVFKYSHWNRYSTKKKQSEFLEFINEKYKDLTKQMRKAKDKGKSKEKIHKMQQGWLKKKGVTLENFWKKELWE